MPPLSMPALSPNPSSEASVEGTFSSSCPIRTIPTGMVCSKVAEKLLQVAPREPHAYVAYFAVVWREGGPDFFHQKPKRKIIVRSPRLPDNGFHRAASRSAYAGHRAGFPSTPRPHRE
jgi:hypothetical protein